MNIPLTPPASVARGRLLVVAAALLWSLSGLLVKSPPLVAIPETDRGAILAFYRTLFATACLLPFVSPKCIRWRPMLLPLVVSFGAMNLLFIMAMTKTTAAAAIFLQYTSTVWVFLFGVLFLGEAAHRGNLIALAGALAGIGWIVGAGWAGQHAAGNLLALGAGAAYAGVILSLRHLRDESSAWLIALCHAGGALVILPWFLPARNISLDLQQWLLIAALGIVQMALPYILFARGVRTVTAQEAALLPLLEPILNPLWVWLFWREPVDAPTWIGGTLILGGLAARYLLFPISRNKV